MITAYDMLISCIHLISISCPGQLMKIAYMKIVLTLFYLLLQK